MFKSKFAREMVQFNSLAEEVLCGAYYSDTLSEGDEEEWMTSHQFKKILNSREEEARSMRLWDARTSVAGSDGALLRGHTARPIQGIVAASTEDMEDEEQDAECEEMWEAASSFHEKMNQTSTQDIFEEGGVGGTSRYDMSADIGTPTNNRSRSRMTGTPHHKGFASPTLKRRRSSALTIFPGYQVEAADLRSSSIQKDDDWAPSTLAQIHVSDGEIIAPEHPTDRREHVLEEPIQLGSSEESDDSVHVSTDEDDDEDDGLPCNSPLSQRSKISRVETVVTLGLVHGHAHASQQAKTHGFNQDKVHVESDESPSQPVIQDLEFEVRRLKTENKKLVEELEKIHHGYQRYKSLEKEVEELQWQIGKMENSKKMYEEATQQLVAFLDRVTEQLATTGGNGQQQHKDRLSNACLWGRMANSSWDVSGPTSNRAHRRTRLSCGSHAELASYGYSSANELTDKIEALAGILGKEEAIRPAASRVGGHQGRLSLAPNLEASINRRFSRSVHNLGTSFSEVNARLGRTAVAGGSSPRLRAKEDHAHADLEQEASFRVAGTRLSGAVSSLELRSVKDSDHKRKANSRLDNEHRRRSVNARRSMLNDVDPGAKKTRQTTQGFLEVTDGRPISEPRPGGSDCGVDSIESKDSGRSTEPSSGDSGRSSPSSHAHQANRSSNRRLLVGRARNMVKSIKHFLAKEKSYNGYKEPRDQKDFVTSDMESPWIFGHKERMRSPSNGDESSLSHVEIPSRTVQNPAFKEEADSGCGKESNKIIISINSSQPSSHKKSRSTSQNPGVKSDATTNNSSTSQSRVKSGPEVTVSSPRKSHSFGGKDAASGGGASLIRITRMGAVSVPVPYPINGGSMAAKAVTSTPLKPNGATAKRLSVAGRELVDDFEVGSVHSSSTAQWF